MNQLNSLIIEGTISQIDKSMEDTCLFVLENKRRIERNPGELIEDTIKVDVECYGKMAQAIKKVGTGVRVVGRLAHYPTPGNKLYVVAEHIEIKR